MDWIRGGKVFLRLVPSMNRAAVAYSIPLRWSEDVWPAECPSTGEYWHRKEMPPHAAFWAYVTDHEEDSRDMEEWAALRWHLLRQ